MRGKRCRIHQPWRHPRIIPAHAGQTLSKEILNVCGTDHPRACGANYPPLGGSFDGDGSSPRMRGKRHAGELDALTGRIIPAHAGQTESPRGRRALETDHPRACGANGLLWDLRQLADGSSPRMRGKRRACGPLPYFVRIIPAHAGQTGP